MKKEDPCAEFGPTQRWAVVWFFGALFVGALLTYRLAKIDRWMYDNNGEFLDYTAYKENRLTSTGIPSESSDPRKFGDYVTATKHLESDSR